MNKQKFESILQIGETIAIEYKRCGNGIENDATVQGVLEKAARDMIGNTLIHREFASMYTAKFVIEQNRVYTKNASRFAGDGVITPKNMEPNPKNPIIASFFRNIGWSA